MNIKYKDKKYERTDKPFTPENILIKSNSCNQAALEVVCFMKIFILEHVFLYRVNDEITLTPKRIKWLTPYTPWLVEHGFWRECEEKITYQWYIGQNNSKNIFFQKKPYKELIRIQSVIGSIVGSEVERDIVSAIKISPPIITDTSNLTAEGCAHYDRDHECCCPDCERIGCKFNDGCEYYAIKIGTTS